MDTTDDAGENGVFYCRKIRSNHETAHKRASLNLPILGGLFDVDYGISNYSVTVSVVEFAQGFAIAHFTSNDLNLFTLSLISSI